MNAGIVERDERTLAVENASFRWSYIALSYGLLVVVAVRSFFGNEAPWDLLGLVVLGGIVNAAYQVRERVLGLRWTRTTVIAIVLSALIAAALAFLRGRL